MALFEWKKLNFEVTVADTRKQYYNKYYCSIKYFCPGGRVIMSKSDDIAKVVEMRKQLIRAYNYGSSWRSSRERLNLVSVSQLEAIRAVRQTYSSLIKFRVEEPGVIIYSVDESTLVDVATELHEWNHTLQHVTRPRDNTALAVLGNGSIISKENIGYQFKFMCKEGVCYNKNIVASYLTNLGDQVKVSKKVMATLTGPGTYIYGIWFYASDASIATMLNIIEPNFVKNIHEVVQA